MSYEHSVDIINIYVFKIHYDQLIYLFLMQIHKKKINEFALRNFVYQLTIFLIDF